MFKVYVERCGSVKVVCVHCESVGRNIVGMLLWFVSIEGL